MVSLVDIFIGSNCVLVATQCRQTVISNLSLIFDCQNFQTVMFASDVRVDSSSKLLEIRDAILKRSLAQRLKSKIRPP